MKNETGGAGEQAVAGQLRKSGYTILERNFRCRFGEIDIIAQNSQYIVFVEVKTRSEKAAYSPLEAITAAKRRKILLTAQLYLQQKPSGRQPRFDAAAVFTENGQVIRTEYLENAFSA